MHYEKLPSLKDTGNKKEKLIKKHYYNTVIQCFLNGAPQGLARCATLAFCKFTTCFLHYSLFSGIHKIGYNDHSEVIRYPTLQLLQPYSWHKTLFLVCCST